MQHIAFTAQAIFEVCSQVISDEAYQKLEETPANLVCVVFVVVFVFVVCLFGFFDLFFPPLFTVSLSSLFCWLFLISGYHSPFCKQAWVWVWSRGNIKGGHLQMHIVAHNLSLFSFSVLQGCSLSVFPVFLSLLKWFSLYDASSWFLLAG